MSEVYVVEEPSTGEHLALKLLTEVGDAVPRFNREYEALTRLNYPGIVRVYHYGIYRGKPWFSMELLEGRNLQAWIKSTGRPGHPGRTVEVIRIAYYMSTSLAYIHRRGLIHRDLKSANVMVLPDGRVKLLDFGTAHLRDAIEPITRDGEFIGTFAYASPEQFQGHSVDHRADLYTLGVLLYRLATGRRPFSSTDPAELAQMHSRTIPKAPIEHIPALPEGLNDLIMSLLEKNPDDRPQKASSVIRTLVEIAGRPLNLAGFGLAIRNDRPVGREKDLQTMETVLDGTSGRALLVTGGAGSGLVGFANMAAMRARERKIAVLVSTLHQEDPLKNLVEVILEAGESMEASIGSKLDTACMGLRKILAKPLIGRWKRRELLYIAVNTVLREKIEKQQLPILLVVHHQHLASPLVLELLVRLVRTATNDSLPLQFLFTADPVHLHQYGNARHRFPGALRLQLKPLDVRQVALSVGSMLYRRPPPLRAARYIHQISGGEPLWIERVVYELVELGALRVYGVEGNHLEWDPEAAKTLEIPLRAKQAVMKSLNSLPRYHRRLLEAMAIVGDDAPVSLLSTVMDWSVETLRWLLLDLAASSWVIWKPGDFEVRWGRLIDARVIAEQIEPGRLGVFHRALEGAITNFEPSESLVDVLLAMGKHHDALALARTCAGRMIKRNDWFSALRVLRKLVKAMGDDEVRDSEMFGEVHLMHAQCLMRIRPVDPMLSRSLTVARTRLKQPESLAKIDLLHGRLQRQIGHYPNFRKYVEKAWVHAETTTNSRLQSQVASYQMQGALSQGQAKRAESWLDVAVQAANESQDELVKAYAGVMVGNLMFSRGRIVEAEKILAESMTVFQRKSHPRGLWLALPRWSESLRFQGRFSEALAQLHGQVGLARESQVPLHYLQLILAIARCEVDLCRLGRGQECIDELEVSIRRGEQLHIRLETMLTKGRILIMSGQNREALATLQDVYKRGRAADLPVVSEYARALMAEALWDLRTREEAAGMFEAASLGLLATGNIAMLALSCASRSHAMAGQMDPDVIFEPIKWMLDEQPIAILRVEHLIARARWHRRHKQRSQSRDTFRQAATLLNSVADVLNDTDRAALRVHPWSRHIHRGMRM